LDHPGLLNLPGEAAYRAHYEAALCRQHIQTVDGIRVFFPKHQFNHAFFESTSRRLGDKSVFSLDRARRIDWIAPALADANADLYEGWDKRKRVHTRDSRACVAFGDYVVIIMLNKDNKASFVTAFPAKETTLTKIQSGPRW